MYIHMHVVCLCLQVNVEQRSRVSNVTQEVRSGSLYMVDLAGSERAAVTQVGEERVSSVHYVMAIAYRRRGHATPIVPM